MKSLVTKVNEERQKIRAAVIEAIGPVSAYELANFYGTSRSQIKRILEDEFMGMPTGRKAKGRSSAEIIEMMKLDYKSKTKQDYIDAITAAIRSLDI
jgi:predicted HTH transcriptional regulator